MSGARLAFLCDESGRIHEVLRDDLGLIPEPSVGVPLPALGTEQGTARCFDMLDALQAESAILGWMVELRTPQGAMCLHFAGVRREGEILLVGSGEPADVSEFSEELARTNNEHATRLRELLKERVRGANGSPAITWMTELNNANNALERDVLKQRQELAALLRAKNELLGMAAHDLRNPLGAIAGLIELLGMDESLDGSQRALITDVQQAIDLMIEILDGVLDEATIQSGRLQLSFATCELEAMVSRAASLCRVRARSQGVTIELRSQGPIEIEADETRLHQVLNNLLANALTHAPQGSAVRIEIERRGNEGCVRIRDAGRGIPDDERALIFEPFRRGAAERGRGSGLGLAIASRILEAHGGSLSLMRDAGPGACFEFRVPIRALRTGPLREGH